MNASGSAENCVVFDIGGTRTRAALFDIAEGALKRVTTCPTPSRWSLPDHSPGDIRERLLREIQALVCRMTDGDGPRQLAIAFPGPVTPAGHVLAAPTIWGLTDDGGFDLQGWANRHWPSACVHVMNDVTAAGYRYLRSERDSLDVITVGSGMVTKPIITGSPFSVQ